MSTHMHIKQRFQCSAETLAKLLADDEFDRLLMAHLKIGIEVLDSSKDGDVLSSTLKLSPPTKIPGFMKKMIKSSAYTENRRWDMSKLQNDWSIQLSFAADRVDIRGVLKVVSDGDNACYRVNDGDFSIKLKIIGKKIEQFIIRETEATFEAGAKFITKYISDNNL